jgi:hypothetical protein
MISFDCNDTLKSFNSDLFLHKSKSTKINILKKKNYSNYRNSKNKNAYLNKKRNYIHDFSQLTSLFNCINILNSNTNSNTNANNKTKLENNSEQNINSINNKYSVSKGNSKRYIKKIETNINKLIKRKKIINLNTMRYNISNKKIPLNKTYKDSTFNLSLSNSNNQAITSNHNYYKKNQYNNQVFFRLYKNFFYINNIKANNINKKILTNNSFVVNKMLYNQTISKENINFINNANLKLNKSLKIKRKEKQKNKNLNYIQFNKCSVDKNKGKNNKNLFLKINGKNKPEDNKDKAIKSSHNKNKNEEKFIRTVFKNNSILNNSQKN